MISAQEQRPGRLPRRSTLALLPLSFVALVNLATLTEVDRTADDVWKVRYMWQRSSVLETQHVSEVHGLFVRLGELVPGAQYIIPEKRIPGFPPIEAAFRPRIYGLGRASRVIPHDYDFAGPDASFDYSEHVVEEGILRFGASARRNVRRSQYRIVLLDTSADRLFILSPSPTLILFVDERLVPSRKRRVHRHEPDAA